MNKPLRIGLIMQGGRGWLGGTQYIRNIILALGSLPDDVRMSFEVCLFCRQTLESSLYRQLEPHVKNVYYRDDQVTSVILQNRVVCKIISTLFGQNDPLFESVFRREKIDFVYPYFTMDRWRKPYRDVPWIYDFQHRYLPELFTEREIQKRDRLFGNFVRHASTIVVSSKTAEADLDRFFPAGKGKTEVLQFRSCPEAKWYKPDPGRTPKEYFLPDRFFLVSNQFWQHKNHLVLFEALKILRERSIHPNVVCTGHVHDYRHPDYSDTILKAIHKWGISGQVFLLGLIPRLDQIQLMRRSLAVIQPSLFEGWNTVIEDSRAVGKPLIVSDIPVHREQNPPRSVFFEPRSAEGLATLLMEWWERLQPGPEKEEEAIARRSNSKEVQDFGFRFLEIARGR